MAKPLVRELFNYPTESSHEMMNEKSISISKDLKTSFPCDNDEDSCASLQSRSIPIRHHIHRTASEIQLHEDEAVADYRDYCMYYRIVKGISHKNNLPNQAHHQGTEEEETLRNLTRTRLTIPTEYSVQEQNQDSSSFSQSQFIPSFETDSAIDRLDSLADDFALSYENDNMESSCDYDEAIFDMDL
mmetsp:Transcript_30780/g.47183  ORF Transcript_30780/g.47183 Transcript_30780/m.47183 type:complete len:187 (+) Transcript_30780:56-616(+)